MALSRPWAQFKDGAASWWINREFDSPDLRARLRSPDTLMAPPAERLARDAAPRHTEVARADWGGPQVYIKRYRQKNFAQTVKDIFRPSRARRTFETSFALNERGIPTPLPIAVGEIRAGRSLKEAYLITRAVPDAKTFFEHRALAKRRAQTRILMRTLARALAKLHDAGYSHSDPNLSNWLVVGPAYPDPKLLAIDLDGVRDIGNVSAKAAAKDLYRLVRYMSSYERAWFVAQYCRVRKRRLEPRAFLRLCQAHM
ncbi:MAG TPA: lipopolysaccharide kinase InaA family protein [Verrucomicrobiae bacterium]|nr:lipopolysaccharide kinase InaA family protein [Verrucomicrobiae bacterium]